MNVRRSMSHAALLGATILAGPAALAQTSYVAPDGRNRFPAVTIFCPSGTGVAPCNFGGGAAASGAVSLTLGGTAVSAGNQLPVADSLLDGLISGGALSVGGTVSVGSLPPVSLGSGASTIGAVAQAGAWMMNLSGALPAGTNALGSVSVSNLPATQAVNGTVTVSALPALPAGGNTIGAVTIAGTPTFICSGCGAGGGAATQGAGSAANPWWMQGLGAAGAPAGGVLTMQGASGGVPVPVSGTFWQATQPVSGTVSLSGLPPLPAGGNAIGSVSVSNLPATQAISAASLPLPAGAATSVLQPALNADGGALVHIANPTSSISVSNLPATQAVSAAAWPLPSGAAQDSSVQAVKTALGTPMQQTGGSVAVASLPALPAGANAIGQVSVSNLPATQAISAAALPLPAGAATAASQAAPLAPVAPGTATATSAVLLGCQAATSLPSFTAGQQGAVPCDTSGRPYVVTVPSANNVPSFLQAVTAGGATTFRAINAASSAMAAAVKGSSGMIYGYEACNSGASAAYLRFFAQGTAPTVGSSVPALTKLLPAGGCQTMTTSLGLVFSGGIAMDVTSGSLADSDTATVATASQVVVSVYYK